MLGSGDGKNNSHQALWATLFQRLGQNLAVNRIRLGLVADFWVKGPKLPQICAKEKGILVVALQNGQGAPWAFLSSTEVLLPSFSDYFTCRITALFQLVVGRFSLSQWLQSSSKLKQKLNKKKRSNRLGVL